MKGNIMNVKSTSGMLRSTNRKRPRIYQVNIPVGDLPKQKALILCKEIKDQCKKIFNKNDKFIITSFQGEGKVEFIRLD